MVSRDCIPTDRIGEWTVGIASFNGHQRPKSENELKSSATDAHGKTESNHPANGLGAKHRSAEGQPGDCIYKGDNRKNNHTSLSFNPLSHFSSSFEISFINRGSMKKGIIVLLIAVLVSGFAFAGFSGYAGIQLNADLNNKEYGFANKPDASFTFEFAADTKELTGEKLYGELKATAKAIVDKIGKAEGLEKDYVYLYFDNGDSGDGTYALGLVLKIETAKIVGDGWFVDILGVKSAYDYAKAAVATAYQDKDKNAFDLQKQKTEGTLIIKKWKKSASSYKVAYDKAPGVAFGYAGFVASVGFLKNATGTAFSATIETPEFAFSDDAVKVQAAAMASKKAGTGKTNVGAAVKTTIAIQDVKLGVAADFGLEKIGKEAEFNMDARVDFTYNFVAVNVYTYLGPKGIKIGGKAAGGFCDVYKDFYLEAKAAFDLNAFELPLKVAITAKNIVDKNDKGVVPGISVDFAKDALTAGASFEINLKSPAAWTAKAKAKYDFEQFTAGAGIQVKGKDGITAINAAVFAETDKLVQNVRLGLGYGLNADNLMEDGGWTAIGDGEYSADFKAEKAGVISAYAIIKF